MINKPTFPVTVAFALAIACGALYPIQHPTHQVVTTAQEHQNTPDIPILSSLNKEYTMALRAPPSEAGEPSSHKQEPFILIENRKKSPPTKDIGRPKIV